MRVSLWLFGREVFHLELGRPTPADTAGAPDFTTYPVDARVTDYRVGFVLPANDWEPPE